MVNKNKKNNKIILFIIISLVIFFGFILLIKAFYSTTKTYYSDTLNISFNYPQDYQLEEKFAQIYLTESGKLIMINRITTNKIYNNLDEFVKDKENLITGANIFERKKFVIDGYEAVSVLFIYPNDQSKNNKAYYIFANGAFYHFYTTSPELYNDLDRIAESFRYKP